LISRLQNTGHKVTYTREPGGTRTGEAIREILQHDKTGEALNPRAEVYLFAASRSQLCDQVILPAIERGEVVISDRFIDSTSAYQGYGRGFPLETIYSINNFAIGKAVPDLTCLLYVPVEKSFERLAARQQQDFQGLDRIEREAKAFHERVGAGYLELAQKYPERIKLIDATQNLDQVEEAVWQEVKKSLFAKYS
ncbi:dTMP kinase, partial [Candidatus Pacearchaeota archaeon]|nr:dTMP kinase [Candidatus Pacearchaeota archaeon]